MATEKKIALVSGITGQDGSYLADLLLSKGYEVHGIMRRSSSFNTGRIEHIYSSLNLHYGDLSDGMGLREILTRVQPDEVYNLGAQSHVRVSFDQPVYTVNVDALGTINILEAIRDTDPHRRIRFYQASSSEMFGDVQEVPQTEKTPFYPRSPYGCAKLYSHWQTVNYSEAYGMFACSGILFNHESPRRGETFVTRKITRAATRIKLGLQKHLTLGNLSAKRDWGFAGDYVVAMWQMLQQDKPDDYVIATNETHSINEFLNIVFAHLDMDWHEYVRIDSKYFRPSEVDLLIGDYSKAKERFGWQPKVTFRDLAIMMTDEDLKLAQKEKLIHEA